MCIQEQAERGKGKGHAKGVTAFEQRELVARAFAGDSSGKCPHASAVLPPMTNTRPRNSLRPNGAKSTKMCRRKLTPDGYA